MQGTNYEVYAKLVLRGTGQAHDALQRISAGLQTLGARIRGTGTGLSNVMRQIAGVAAAYVGFRAIENTFGGLVRSAVSYNAELEATKIGLQSILSVTSGGALSFEAAGDVASSVFRQLTDDAIKSVATTQELFAIYQGIVGPIRAAGFGLDTVRELTNSTVAAASALNVDFGQAQRDISLMVRGAAGMDVKLFSMLRSTGAITESTEEWNRNLSAQERVEKLREALAKFTPAAEAYGRSWRGITSSLTDIYQQFLGALSAPIMNRVKEFLGGWVQRLIEQRDRIKATLQAVGELIAGQVGRALDAINDRVSFIVRNWDRIIDRLGKVFRIVKSVAPPAIMTLVGIRLARTLLGGGLQMFGAILGPIMALLSLVGPLMSAFGGGGGIMAILGGGGAAAAGVGGAGAAAAAGTVGAIAWPVVLAALAAAAGILAGLALLAAELAAVGYVLYTHWEEFLAILDNLTPVVSLLWATVQEATAKLWELVRPIAKLVGIVLIVILFYALTTAISILQTFLEGLIKVLDFATAALGGFETAIDSLVTSVFSHLGEESARLGERAGGREPGSQGLGGRVEEILASLSDLVSGTGEEGSPTTGPAVNDFRGSRIEVRQEFRQADPDRIMIQMLDAIHHEAESRIQSGFVPALTR